MLVLNCQDVSVKASTRNVARRPADSPVQPFAPAGPARPGLHGSKSRTGYVKSRKVQTIVARATKASPGPALPALAVPFSLGTGDIFVAGAPWLLECSDELALVKGTYSKGGAQGSSEQWHRCDHRDGKRLRLSFESRRM